MSTSRPPGRGPEPDPALSIQRIRSELSARLRERSAEIEGAILFRIYALSTSEEAHDAEYVAGLREAVRDSVDFGITSIERGAEWAPPAPPVVATQAQRAARSGVSLDTILRRYAAGDRIMSEFLVEEADKFPGQILGQVMKERGPLVDRLMAHAATHYMRELERMTRTPEQRLAELVERLLGGDVAVDVAELDYVFDHWHIGLIVSGQRAEMAARGLADDMGRRLLLVPRGPRTAWAWLGATRRPGTEDVERYLDSNSLRGVSLALGEPRQGLDGWRLTHREAQAGFEVMLRGPEKLIRGSEVLLLAAMLRDDDLAKSLLSTYLAPLDEQRGAGPVLRETLRAYLSAGRNAATAAAVLEVDRHTVQRRLRKVEEVLGRHLNTCHAELEVALGLEEMIGIDGHGE